jgi:drug/metabolite transporter (DMT)-like permease
MAHAGELAALITALFYSFSSTFFTFATRNFTSIVMNRIRLLMAACLILIIHSLFFGSALPLNAGPSRWFWLGTSGIIGLVLGDVFLYQAYRAIGARMGMLLLSLSPVIAALVAWLFLGETLGIFEILGIIITLAGIAWVVMNENGTRKNGANHAESKTYLIGLVCGLGAATGQAFGMVLSKKGLSGGFSPISGNVIRIVTAAVTLWIITLLQGQAKPTFEQLSSQPRSIWPLVAGMIAGPILGVSFSLYAVQNANVGVASTLIALPPIFLLPISYFVFKEHIGWSAIAGTFLAMVGVAILFIK